MGLKVAPGVECGTPARDRVCGRCGHRAWYHEGDAGRCRANTSLPDACGCPEFSAPNAHGCSYQLRDGYERCEYCGSLTPAEALRRMTTPGCKWSGTDKGSYKFYFEDGADHGKFYGEHLDELTAEQLVVWSRAARRVLGFNFRRDQTGRIVSSKPQVDSFYGWQTFGTIGPDGAPVFADGSPQAPDEDWWKDALISAAEHRLKEEDR